MECQREQHLMTVWGVHLLVTGRYWIVENECANEKSLAFYNNEIEIKMKTLLKNANLQ